MAEGLEGATQRLRDAADRASLALGGLAGDSVAELRAGKWDGRLTASQAGDLADLLAVMTERLRYTGALAEQPLERPTGPILSTIDRPRLPVNRKERYYTGTVLPMIVASDGFAHLDRFLGLCGLDVRVQGGLDGEQDLQFFTEYGFAESVFTAADKESWPDPVEADTPDVVVAGPDWLLAVEAKMFHNPNAAALTTQMRRQRAVVEVWTKRLGLDPGWVRHVLLLPQRLRTRVGAGLSDPVVTWEQVLESYWAVSPRYWAIVLEDALARHEQLESVLEKGFRKNADAVLLGADIVAEHSSHTLEFDHVGRGGGLQGNSFQEDVRSGRWRTTQYEVRQGALPGNPNWFSLSDFLAATARAESPPS